MYVNASRGFTRGLLSGIARYSALHGRWTFYRQLPSYLTTSRQLDLDDLRAWKPNGVMCPVSQAGVMSQLGVPMIVFDSASTQEELPMIITDDAAVGHLAAEHLMNQGNRHFAFCGFDAMAWSNRRRDAYCQALEEAGWKAEVYIGSKRQISQPKEETRIANWLRSLPKPVGVFCCNDDRAAIVTEIALGLGCQLPDEISIMGADDDGMICELINPPLTSVRIMSKQAGYEAAALLDDLMQRKQKMGRQRVVAPVSGVNVRHSTDMLMIKNPVVRRALRFIRDNANRQIQVRDVVSATGLNHRTLNAHFHAELGTSIGKHLSQARVDVISKLLIDTDMRIQEIAHMVGHEDDRHFARYFKRMTGVTPKAYRKKMSTPPGRGG